MIVFFVELNIDSNSLDSDKEWCHYEKSNPPATDGLFLSSRTLQNTVCFMAVVQYANWVIWCLCPYDIV